MSCTQRTVQEIFADEKLDHVYVLAIFPTWEYWQPTSLPVPLAAWIYEHCPDVAVEMMAILTGTPQFHATDDTRYLEGTFLSYPMFRIGFSPEQAEQFAQHWEVVTGGARDDFLFLEIERPGGTPPSPTDEDIRACIEDARRHFQSDRAAR